MSSKNTNTPEETQGTPKTKKGVLVNLELPMAEAFYALSKSGKFFNKKNPTAVARELILQFVESNTSQAATAVDSE